MVRMMGRGSSGPRYGKQRAPYSHFTVIAEVAGNLEEGITCRPGSAFMSMKAWASSTDEATDMVLGIGQQIGFTVIGCTHVYGAEPSEPPGDNPCAYDIRLTPFDPEEQ